jgi:protein-S-isoprenylcysteine O-methyltransferase Ste14
MGAKNRQPESPVSVRSVAILAVLSAIWATIHSLLASEPVKQSVRERFGPGSDRWYRVFFVVMAGLTLWPIVPLLMFLPDRNLYAVRTPWRWLLHAGQAAAGAETAGAVAQAGFPRFVGLAQLQGEEGAERLETTRFYGCVRHPMTLFSLLLIWLSPTMTLNKLTAFVMASLYFLIGIRLEERKLSLKFGDAYRAYRAEVPRLIPRPGRCLRAWQEHDEAKHDPQPV